MAADTADGIEPAGPAQNGTHPSADAHAHPSRTVKGHVGTVSCVKFKPGTGDRIVSSSSDATLRVWSTDECTELACLKGHQYGVSSAIWSCSGEYICSASDDKTAKLWDTSTGQCLRTLSGHTSFVFCCAWNSHGNIVATGSFDETLRLWDVRSTRCVRTTPAHSDPVTGVSFNTDGSMIASCSFDGLVRLWDVYSGHCLKTLVTPKNPPIGHVMFTPNGQYVCSSALSSCHTMWRCARLEVLKEYEGHKCEGWCSAAAFSTVGKQQRLVSGSEDGAIFTWDVNAMKVVQKFEGDPNGVNGHSQPVLCVDAHPANHLLVSCALKEDGSFRLWQDTDPQNSAV